ncbi:hypothetical protein ACFL2Z_00630 [Candidatus Eisenbacteria bacterium]|uniref:Uncharacterized protein n=1 Tax=Eiseniibacteriota bacterium TaxID=2212470 RepID=A0ABV6YMW6_UNCEI
MKSTKKQTQPKDSPFSVEIEYEPADDAEERLLMVYEFLLEEVAAEDHED